MSIVHTLLGARPPARSDGKPWIEVRIEHSDSEEGPWAEDETQDLDPVDTDPSNPQKRNVTFKSDEAEAYFRLVFIDADANESAPTDPVFDDGSGVSWRPTVAEVASVIVSHTFVAGTLVGSDNNLAGTFNSGTRPTDAQVRDQIANAVIEVAPRIIESEDTTDEVLDLAKLATARRAALLVLASYFNEGLEQANSGYDEVQRLYLDALKDLEAAHGDSAVGSRGMYSLRMRSEVSGALSTAELLP